MGRALPLREWGQLSVLPLPHGAAVSPRGTLTHRLGRGCGDPGTSRRRGDRWKDSQRSAAPAPDPEGPRFSPAQEQGGGGSGRPGETLLPLPAASSRAPSPPRPRWSGADVLPSPSHHVWRDSGPCARCRSAANQESHPSLGIWAFPGGGVAGAGDLSVQPCRGRADATRPGPTRRHSVPVQGGLQPQVNREPAGPDIPGPQRALSRASQSRSFLGAVRVWMGSRGGREPFAAHGDLCWKGTRTAARSAHGSASEHWAPGPGRVGGRVQAGSQNRRGLEGAAGRGWKGQCLAGWGSWTQGPGAPQGEKSVSCSGICMLGRQRGGWGWGAAAPGLRAVARVTRTPRPRPLS